VGGACAIGERLLPGNDVPTSAAPCTCPREAHELEVNIPSVDSFPYMVGV